MKIFTDEHNNFHLEANYTSITRVTDPLAHTHTHIYYIWLLISRNAYIRGFGDTRVGRKKIIIKQTQNNQPQDTPIISFERLYGNNYKQYCLACNLVEVVKYITYFCKTKRFEADVRYYIRNKKTTNKRMKHRRRMCCCVRPSCKCTTLKIICVLQNNFLSKVLERIESYLYNIYVIIELKVGVAHDFCSYVVVKSIFYTAAADCL